MSCQLVHTENSQFFMLRWGPENDRAMATALNPSPPELIARQKTIEGRLVEPLVNFLSKRGIPVVRPEPSASPLAAAMAEWNSKLRTRCETLSDTEFSNVVGMMGVGVRDLQIEALLKVYRTYFGLLAAGCGAGKTRVVLLLTRLLKKLQGKATTFVFAPRACSHEYVRELHRLYSAIGLTLEDLTRVSFTEGCFRIELGDADIYLCGIESAHRFITCIKDKLAACEGSTLLVIDEGHAIKNVSARRSRALQEIAPFFDRVLVSTATPTPLGPIDIRGYLSLVTYPQPEELYGNEIPASDMELLENVTFVSDETDLEFSRVEKQRILFNSDEQLDEIVMREVMSEISDPARKAVIFCSTNRALVRLYELCAGVGRTVLSGSYSLYSHRYPGLLDRREPELQQRAIEEFNQDPKCQLLIANYRVGSTGINLQYSGARMAFFYEVPISGADFYQSEYRIRRPYVFPEGGFRYVYAVPGSHQGRLRAERQFQKLERQRELLQHLKLVTR